MKNIITGLFAIMLIAGCKEADKAADAKAALQDTIDKANEIARKMNQANAAGLIPNADSANVTTVEWLDSQELDMGKITEGQDLEVAFRFKNTGNKPLLISNVTAQCGCTIPETPQEPFLPGESGTIKAKFSSAGRGGSLNTKEVYVDANLNPGRTVLVFKVEVLKKG
jgi:hypothetical protein